MKVFSRLLMMALVLSVFTSCGKDDDGDKNLPLAGIAATYEGTLTIPLVDTVPNATIIVGTPSGSNVELKIPTGTIKVMPVEIKAMCTVTSDSEKYSLSGSVSVPISDTVSVPITIENSSKIDKTGNADIDIKVSLDPTMPLVVKFTGRKK
jgi:hypothetical protein